MLIGDESENKVSIKKALEKNDQVRRRVLATHKANIPFLGRDQELLLEVVKEMEEAAAAAAAAGGAEASNK